ncbi:hypothetical protein MW344_003752 [Vibrio parahaemolyticus]|uniref:Uncharacterized protein n=1 Tax=Vibrio parahaemolyticus TaxID=670 RepID=A0A9Q3UIE4_VIBPH|nr:hypothetical protein [Vibrio parahaemolyticus]EGQ8101920.1 hypothetical protein [Vibrio parahaemolyticus]EGQ8548775.1 hypothetical protein [Vibrio parahaemolyticus]EGQ9073806.1 hypothetical protein [Vibrio parahaemolyticus]EGQ9129695.1 hypothetical protein [Vibrio parahaemolyticus]EGQ9286452.1 hypothetical protein [Vibrio parahaemolyticus]
MTRQNSTLTLSKSQSATNVSPLEHESSPKNDISWCLLKLLPKHLDPSKVVSVVLRAERFGSWDTPREQWEAGFILMAVESSGREKYVKSFLLSQVSVSAIKQECGEIAKALSATLIDTTINFNQPQIGK